MTLVIDAVISTDDKFSRRRNHSGPSSANAKASRVQSSVVNDCSASDKCVSLSSEMHLGMSSIGLNALRLSEEERLKFCACT